MTVRVESSGSVPAPSYRRLFAIAWPIVLANVAAPLLGLIDTAVIGNLGRVADLGAIALGSLIFSLIYWGFGFLRMGTTGFTAQAAGTRDTAEIRACFMRNLLLGWLLAGMVLALQWPLVRLILSMFDASASVEAGAAAYLSIRLWGVPAALGLFVVCGSLIGRGHSRTLMLIQLAMNALNIVLDVLLAGVLEWGVEGVALGTAVSEWLAFGLGGWLLLRGFRDERIDAEPFWPWSRIRRSAALVSTLKANRDIMIRTLLMLVCFAWFTNAGAVFGDQVLAANHVLLQFVTFSAYFLDGFAFAAESQIGAAYGRRDPRSFDLTVRRSTVLAFGTACALAGGLWMFGAPIVHVLTDLEAVRAVAAQFLPWAIAYVALSFGAFQLDGIFIGMTATAQMRNASLLSAGGFLLLAMWWSAAAGNAGLWAAFVCYVVLRAAALLIFYPALRRRLVAGSP
ncbi:MATE family efflux transporter [uncultured Abyssibacter sp.]|uniref:MATE family efflux transporter n=1 Tax=uncultured Abyssibacter sp. TaxID=2320202 RepID=UPI0032B0FCAF